MAYTNPADINATAGLPEFLSYVNSVSDGWFVNMLLITIFLIILVPYTRASNDFLGGMAVASFGTFVISTFFFLGQFIHGITYSLVIAFMLVFSLALFLRNK